MTNKEIYKKLCDEYPIPLFSQYWWMDIVCKKGIWDVFLFCENDKVLASMPYMLLKKWSFKYILQPPLTQTNGIWINYPEKLTTEEKYRLENRVSEYFIRQLDALRVSFFSQCFHYSFTNWQQFYWNKFKQTTRYTFVLNNINDPELLENEFSYAKRKQIKKSQNLFLNMQLTPAAFYSFHCKTLAQKGKTNLIEKELFISLCETAVQRNQGVIIALEDAEKNLHAALFVVWDEESAYNLVSAIDTEFASSGASTRVVLEAVKSLSGKTKRFDFEGSMIEGVAKSFAQFGAIQTPYFEISKFRSVWFELVVQFMRSR